MATNRTVESVEVEKVRKEAGNATAEAVNLLWEALNDTRATQRRQFNRATELLAPKVLTLAPSADVDDLDTQGASTILFTGSSAVNFSGMRAPETGQARIVTVLVTGSATITTEHETVSETANQLSNATGANVALDTGSGHVYQYLSSKWREIARSG